LGAVDLDAALADARPAVLWLDTTERPEPRPPLSGDTTADLVVVGGGYTGLWAALRARVEHPSLDVLLVERDQVAGQASGRNGGFVSSSITHGLENGIDRFGGEIDALLSAGHRNFDGLVADLAEHEIDAHLELTGALTVANRPWQVAGLEHSAALHRHHGEAVEWWDRDRVRAEVASPTYEGALFQHEGEALVDPARLGWGLAAACERLGVRLAERTSLVAIERHGAGLAVRTDRGTVRCGAAVLGTGAFASPVRAISRRVVPVYDYVLATEPLDDEQMASIGWRGRQGISDAANQFHYYRLTSDRRILWGGYDAVFHHWGRIDESLDQRDETHRKLAEHFFETFPQLDGVRFSHRWGGVIDTSTRFSVGFGTALDGRVAYAVGYTGLGVGATRFGAQVCVDLLHRPESELLRLDLVRKRLLPFPPEPVRTVGIQLTRQAIARADAAEGRRGAWLRLLDRLGLGFDS
jgi:glycine/D-amino acid oxidase-like deaminating enzyme